MSFLIRPPHVGWAEKGGRGIVSERSDKGGDKDDHFSLGGIMSDVRKPQWMQVSILEQSKEGLRTTFVSLVSPVERPSVVARLLSKVCPRTTFVYKWQRP